MKVLFVASNPGEEDSLELLHEITALQQMTAGAAGEPASFVFLPQLPFHRLHSEILRSQPDILHVSAHGDKLSLALSDGNGHEVKLTAARLRSLLPPGAAPQIIFLSSCDSHNLAVQLKGEADFIVGVNAPVTNLAARTGAVTFYERLLAGDPVEVAIEACDSVVSAIDEAGLRCLCVSAEGVDAATHTLHQPPRIVAGLVEGGRPGRPCTVQFGMFGCPADTTQVVFFSDDPSFIEDGDWVSDDWGRDLCSVARGLPEFGELWSDDDDALWEDIVGDFRLFAVGVRSNGQTFSVTSSLCGALEFFWSEADNKLGFLSPRLAIPWLNSNYVARRPRKLRPRPPRRSGHAKSNT